MKYLKLFENFDEKEIIPQEIIDKLESTDDKRIMETLDDLISELNGEKDEDKLRAYVDDIGVYLEDTSMDKKEADDIYFSLMSIVDENGVDTIGSLDWEKDLEGLDESKKSGVTASLKKKSKASGIPMGILRKVFAKGMQAWNAGHRPGVAQHQWGMGRVNSFITGAGGARKADADLWAKAKAAKARKKKK